MKLKRGTIREDGMVFWRYADDGVNGERWITPEKFKVQNQKDQDRALRRYYEMPEIYKKQSKQFHQNNPTYARDHQRHRQKTDVLYAMAHRCRSRIQQAVRLRGWTKSCKTSEMLGCDWPTLKLHIENQFVKGMSWDNRDKWHIDHWHPLADAKTIEDVIRLNHYTNLRPLWKKENQQKSSKIPTKDHQLPMLL